MLLPDDLIQFFGRRRSARGRPAREVNNPVSSNISAQSQNKTPERIQRDRRRSRTDLFPAAAEMVLNDLNSLQITDSDINQPDRLFKRSAAGSRDSRH